MAAIIYIEADGTEKCVEVAAGRTAMEGAKQGGVEGITADCGGCCACATCHVYVDPAWTDAVGGPNEMEEAMLDFAEERQSNSRLSCQIPVTDALDGLVLRVAQ